MIKKEGAIPFIYIIFFVYFYVTPLAYFQTEKKSFIDFISNGFLTMPGNPAPPPRKNNSSPRKYRLDNTIPLKIYPGHLP